MPYTKKIRIEFSDCDPAGIMFFANIYYKAHSVYESWLRESLPDNDYFNDDKYAIPVTSSEAEYYKPMKAGDKIDVEMNVANITDNTFTTIYRFINNDSPAAIVKIDHAFIDKSVFRKTVIPDDLKELLERFSKKV